MKWRCFEVNLRVLKLSSLANNNAVSSKASSRARASSQRFVLCTHINLACHCYRPVLNLLWNCTYLTL